jgi:putative DNA primase/helicase
MSIAESAHQAEDTRYSPELWAVLSSTPTHDETTTWLAVLAGDANVIEIRAPKAGAKRDSNIVRRFAPGSFAQTARDALRLSGTAPAVYLTLNGVDPGVAIAGRLGGGAKAADIPSRRWLLVDLDPKRGVPDGDSAEVNSTGEEKLWALRTAAWVRSLMSSLGWPEPVIADSGNGAHLLYRVELPNDEYATILIKATLAELADRFDNDGVSVDRKVFDAPRLVKLYGTKACKGEATEARPARYSRILVVPDVIEAIPRETLESFVSGRLKAEAEASKLVAPSPRSATVRGVKGQATAEERAIAYLGKCEPSISGANGHSNAFKVAVSIGPGFSLPPEVTLQLLRSEFNPRCQPPWSDRELEHKVSEAYRVEPRRGWLLDAPRENGRSALPIKTPARLRVVAAHDPAEPDDDRILPNEAGDDPSRLARLFVRNECSHEDGLTVRFWQGQFVEWDKAYTTVAEADVKARLHKVVKAEFDRQNIEDITRWLAMSDEDKGKRKGPPKVTKVTTSLVANVSGALASQTHLHHLAQPPSWLEGPEPFPATDVLPMQNALVHLPSLVNGLPCLNSPTPRYFCPYFLDYNFVQDAPAPALWLEFLASVFPGDPESIATLQDWLGYLLTPDTSQQKVMILIGPKRSGKGTIARIIRALLGPKNVSGPTLTSLGEPYGLSDLIGKPAAIISDARLSGRADVSQIVENLLAISGEDAKEINRKYLPPITVNLTARFTILSNDLPRLNDASGAIVSRLILLKMTQSFLGKENRKLTSQLLNELPGILLWAIEGWQRLNARGHFIQPQSGEAMIEELEDLASPTGAFLKDCCRVDVGASVMTGELYAAWRRWCQDHGRDHPGDEGAFGKNLRSALPQLVGVQRRLPDGSRKRFYEGLTLDESALI